MPTVRIHDREFETFIPAPKIRERVSLLGAQINHDFAGRRPVIVGVLSGALIFMADLVKSLTVECELAFIKVSSYRGTSSTGQVKSMIGINDELKGRDVIIVEDIVDTGETYQYIIGELSKKEPASMRFITLLFKPDALKTPAKPDYVGFEIPTEFVVGYGLDYDGLGRNLNDIYKVKV